MNAVEKKEGKAGRKEQGFEPFSYFFDTAFLAGLFFVEAFLVELFFVDVFLVDGDLALGDLAAFGLFFALLFLLAGDFLVLWRIGTDREQSRCDKAEHGSKNGGEKKDLGHI